MAKGMESGDSIRRKVGAGSEPWHAAYGDMADIGPIGAHSPNGMNGHKMQPMQGFLRGPQRRIWEAHLDSKRRENLPAHKGAAFDQHQAWGMEVATEDMSETGKRDFRKKIADRNAAHGGAPNAPLQSPRGEGTGGHHRLGEPRMGKDFGTMDPRDQREWPNTGRNRDVQPGDKNYGDDPPGTPPPSIRPSRPRS